MSSKIKCHYEVLGIVLTSSDDDIKKSYRKLALQWHPDKNPENREECTQKFLLIQQAYEVLSDPQERAWYDKHRDAILKGGMGKGDQYEDKSLNLFQYFIATCYSGFDDGPNSFYTVYSKVFEKLADEDVEFQDPTPNLKAAPIFGNSQSSYEEIVGPFYAYWECYNTSKSYVWVETYDTREAPNRQIRRLMETDNKKLRDKAKKERNDEVRTLVSFIRKRDKRIQAYNKKLKERALEIVQLAKNKKEKDRLNRLKKMESYQETGWSATSGLTEELKALELSIAREFGEIDSADETSCDDLQNEVDNCTSSIINEEVNENYSEDLYCVACNKLFKSAKALENHEKSRKHIENIGKLIKQIKDENNDSKEKLSEDLFKSIQPISDPVPSNTSLSKKQKKKRRLVNNMLQNDMEEDAIEDDLQINSDVEDEISITEITKNCLSNEHIDESEIQLLKREDSVPKISNSIEKKKIEINDCKENENKKINNGPHICHVCKAEFDTRNKLFIHVKAEGHAIRIDDMHTKPIKTDKKKSYKIKKNKHKS